MSPTKSETTQKSSGIGTKMESLLKEVYRMHKEVVRSSSKVWKDKFVKMKRIKNKISESRKSLQKEIAALEEKNKSLKEAQKSYLKLNGTCKNCEYLQLKLTTFRNSFQKIFEEKHELIQHLNNQLAATCRDQSFDSSSTKQGLEDEKRNCLKLKSLQRKVVSSQEEGNKFLQAVDSNCSNQEYGKNFVLDSDVQTVGKVSLSPEETLCSESFLFSDCSYGSGCDATDNKNTDLDGQMLYTCAYSNSVKNTENINNLCQTNLEEDGLELSPKQEVTRPVSLAFTSNKKLVSSKTPDMSSFLIASPIIDGPKNIEENQTEADLSTNSPKPKKRRTVRNLSPFQIVSQNALKVSTSKSQSCRLMKESKRKQKIYVKENCLPNPFSPVDPDKTVPPENWNTTTVMQPSEMNDVLTEGSSEHAGVKNRSRNNGIRVVKELVTDSLHNGSLAPSMCMTEFLLENDEPTNNKPEIASKKFGPTKTRHIEEPLIIVPSDSYKFEDGKPEEVLIRDKNHVSEESNTQDNDCSITDSFDRCPWKKKDYPYAYDTVVRKKHDRRLLNGYTCQECVEYYKTKGLSAEEISKQIGDCSKHRAKYKPPNTPEHFWSVGFPDTEECEKRGYFTTESKPSKGKNHKKETDVKEKNDEYRMTQLLNYLDSSGSEEDD
ncbi:uncharacterized protein LOC115210247 isoform X2 [Octopus sinensis]|nr:uncharacterized protein LOC115210247 isoform X2 [Octopus sinensis]